MLFSEIYISKNQDARKNDKKEPKHHEKKIQFLFVTGWTMIGYGINYVYFAHRKDAAYHLTLRLK